MKPFAFSMLIIPLFITQAMAGTDDYMVKSQFGDPVSCGMLPGGVFLIWWDVQNDLMEEAAELLDSLAIYRESLLYEFDMMDPPNVRDGYYFNIYLHEPGDVFPEGWGCGVGTDCYGYPYMTLPIGVLGNWLTVAHETMHVFGYSGDAPGFNHPDANWYTEAGANWFAAYSYPDQPNTFLEAESLVRLPHVSMWLAYMNFPEYYPQNWQRYVHQYGMALFLYYLTHVRDVPIELIFEGKYNPPDGQTQDLLPQEYLYYNFPAGYDGLREMFVDWATHITNDFDFILPSQRETAENEWNYCADPEDDNEFTQIYEDAGSGGWYRPPDSLTTTAWSFNTYKVLNSGDNLYYFQLVGDPWGSSGDPALFRGKVLVRNEIFGARFYDLQMVSNTMGSITLEVTDDDSVLCFIVASVPDVFTDVEQVYSYQIRIEKDASSIEGTQGHTGGVLLDASTPNPFSSSTTVRYLLPSTGHARMTVFDLTGHLVTTLVDGEMQPGWHETAWNGMDASGRTLPDGVYLCRLEASGQMVQTSITILR